MPAVMRQAGAVGASPIGDLRAQRMRAVMSEENAAFAAYRASRTLFGEKQLEALTGSRYPNGTGMQRVPDDVDIERLSLMQQVSLFELTGYMRNTLLRDSDVFSMSHALELRVPLVDLHVARAACAAADAMRLKRGGPKPILVEAVRDLLSPETINRPKKGFTLPFETWMRNEMFKEVDSVLTGVHTENVGLKRSAVADVWQQFQSRRPGVNWSRPWALYTLVRWAAQNGLADAPETLESARSALTLSAAG
jgi:asparagine synthase (glutamine-hydrolysing)